MATSVNKRLRIGTDNPLFRTGKTVDGFGYVQYSSKSHGANRGKREHRVVMEEVIGRPLLSSEIVHHKNENKADNNPSNLAILTRAEHVVVHHAKGSMRACGSCGAERWYSPALGATLSPNYMCRPCRYGRDWNNGRQK